MKRFASLLLSLVLLLMLALPAASTAEEAADPTGKLVIVHTNDIHGRAVVDVDTPSFGYARLSAYVKQLKDAGAKVLLLDAGDASQGLPLVNLSKGENAIDFMNAVGYDAMAIGNHEFDFGADNLLQLQTRAAFPMLAANITRESDGEPLFPANKIFDLGDGVKVGVFGLATPETKTKANPAYTKGIVFAADEALYACAQAQVDELKEAGCTLIVCLSHLGVDESSAPNRSIDVIDHTTGIDLLIDGHSHTEVTKQQGSTMLVSTGSNGNNIGCVTVENSAVTEAKLVPAFDETTSQDPTAGQDEDVAALVNTANDALQAQLSAVFARSDVDLDGARENVRTKETNLGDLSCDAAIWGAEQMTGVKPDMAVMNGGGIRESIAAGDITLYDLKAVFPFNNTLFVLRLTGKELLEMLEASTFALPEQLGAFPQVAGVTFTVDLSVPYENGEPYGDSTYFAPAKPGSRVTITTVGGKAFDENALYTVVTNDFLANGGDTYAVMALPAKTDGLNTGMLLEDALQGYISQALGGTVGEAYAQPQGRITYIGAEAAE